MKDNFGPTKAHLLMPRDITESFLVAWRFIDGFKDNFDRRYKLRLASLIEKGESDFELFR